MSSNTSKKIEGTDTTIRISSGYIVKFSKITIFEEDKNKSKIIYMHGPYEYTIEYFESEDHRDNQYLSGPNSVKIVKEIVESANKRNLDIIASGIIRGIIPYNEISEFAAYPGGDVAEIRIMKEENNNERENP